MKPISALLTLAVALVAMPAFAQKAKATKTPKTAPAATAPAAVPAITKVSGSIKKPGVADGKFTIGSGVKKTRGTWTVDASKATIVDKKGGTIAVTSLTPGSTVTIEGGIDATAKTIAAEKITVTYLRVAKATTPKTTKTPKAAKTPKTPKSPKGTPAPDAPTTAPGKTGN